MYSAESPAAADNYSSYTGINQIGQIEVAGDPNSPYTPAYDSNGNLTSDDTTAYTWDRANRLISVGGHSYQYDGLSHRIQQSVGATVTDYLLDLQAGLPLVLAATTRASTDRFVHSLRGIHAMKNNAGAWRYLLPDGLNSVRSETDANVAVVAAQGYAPYGTPIDTNGSFGTPFGFTGEPRDGNELVHLRARYLNPGLGVFASLDPFEGIAEQPMSLNGYGYTEANPVNRTDPSGAFAGLLGTLLRSNALSLQTMTFRLVNTINAGCLSDAQFRHVGIDCESTPELCIFLESGREITPDTSVCEISSNFPGCGAPPPSAIITNPCAVNPFRPGCNQSPIDGDDDVIVIQPVTPIPIPGPGPMDNLTNDQLAHMCRAGQGRFNSACRILLDRCNINRDKDACRKRRTCDPSILAALQTAKNAECNVLGGRHCNSRTPCSVILTNIVQNQLCLAARWAVVRECFQNEPDNDHLGEILNAQGSMETCIAEYLDPVGHFRGGPCVPAGTDPLHGPGYVLT